MAADRYLTRRTMLRLAGAGLLAATGADALAGCAGGRNSTLFTPQGLPLGPAAGVDLKSGVRAVIVNGTRKFANHRIKFYVIGLNGSGVYCRLKADGTFPPMKLSDNGPNGYADYGIPLSAKGHTAIHLPYMTSARMWFAVGPVLRFTVQNVAGGIGFSAPVPWNVGDPSYHQIVDYIEFSFQNDPSASTQNFNFDCSQVDMFSIPMSVRLVGTDPKTGNRTVLRTGELKEGGRNRIFRQLKNKRDFAPLAVKHGGEWLRAINPQHTNGTGQVSAPKLATFFDDYVNKVWTRYSKETMRVTTAAFGTFSGTVSGGTLDFTGSSSFSFAKPPTADIWECANSLAAPNDAQGAVAAILGAGFNRTNLLDSSAQPKCPVGSYYRKGPVNFWAKILHDNFKGGRCYAFPFDDVCNRSGDNNLNAPKAFFITLGAFT